MYYLYDNESKSIVPPSMLVPMMRRFDSLSDAIAWFDSLSPVSADGAPVKNLRIYFEYHCDARDEVIESHASTLADAISNCPGSEYDIYVQGLDSFGYHVPVNCANKFNAFFKPETIRYNAHGLVEIVA